jgi:exopolysaccharide production protein ExoQ
MSQALALFLCTVFVLFLLRVDRNQAAMVSLGSWIPTFWMLLIATKPLGVWFGLGLDAGDAEGSPLDRAVLIGLLCLGIFLLGKREFDLSNAIRANVWLVLLIGYSLVSVLWSDIPFISFKRWTRDLLAIIMAFLVLTERDPRRAVQSILRRTIYILIPFSWLLVKYYPQYGVEYGRWVGELMWVGASTQKNGLGRLCLISIMFLSWTLVRRWQGHEKAASKYQTLAEVLLSAIALWLLKGGGVSTYSATAVGALIAGWVMFLSFLLVKRRGIVLVARFWLAMIALIFAYGAVLPFIVAGGALDSLLISALGRDQTLTGRTEVWAILLRFYEANPILGHGFGGFWTPATQQAAYGVKEAHNGYLALSLELGVAGLLITAMFLYSIARRAEKALVRARDWATLCYCFLLMIVIHNISESSINSLQRHLTAVLLFVSVVVDARVSKTRARKAVPQTGREGLRPPQRETIDSAAVDSQRVGEASSET